MGENLISEDEWRGLYSEGWKGIIIDEAFAHPAKFARGLIRRIYEHHFDERWLRAGDSVCDPFGGVALGAFEAMRRGLNWTGSELESKFVEFERENIALWNERYAGKLAGWGRAELLQGDSRELVKVFAGLRDACVTSPPYSGNYKSDRTKDEREERRGMRQGRGCFHGSEAYGVSEGQVGSMPEGDFDAVVSSPPYIDTPVVSFTDDKERTREMQRQIQEQGYIEWDGVRYSESEWRALNHGRIDGRTMRGAKKGGQGYAEQSDGQLGAMPEGEFDSVISSPPYAGAQQVDDRKKEPSARSNTWRVRFNDRVGERIEGNLETMKEGDFDSAVTSPPFENSLDRGVVDKDARREFARERGISNAEHISPIDMESHRSQEYGETAGNLGNQKGETFWSASRQILEELYAVLRPGAHASFVLKDFVRKGKRVPFTEQWAQVCEAVGFRLLHHHKALLVEEGGIQDSLFADDEKRVTNYTVSRKSFFRRLHEKKHPDLKIDYESVLCFVKPLGE